MGGTIEKLRRIDAGIASGHPLRRIAEDVGVEYGVVVARARELMRQEVQLTIEEIAAWGACERALIREAQRRCVGPEIQSALRKIRRAVIDEGVEHDA